MENKLDRSGFFAVCVLLLYGSFSSTKYALTMGKSALPLSALALLGELFALVIISLFPTVKARILGFLLSLFPLCAKALRALEGARLLHGGAFSYVPLWMILASSLLLCVYLAARRISACGRVGVIALICTALLLIILAPIYAKDFSGRLLFSERTGGSVTSLMLASAPELVMIYLARSFFACEENDRAAKPPKEKPLCEKKRRKLCFKLTLFAFLTASLMRLAVSAALLSLAHGKIYALANDPASFAARLTEGVNLSPLVSGGIFILELFSFATALSLCIHFIDRTLLCNQK